MAWKLVVGAKCTFAKATVPNFEISNCPAGCELEGVVAQPDCSAKAIAQNPATSFRGFFIVRRPSLFLDAREEIYLITADNLKLNGIHKGYASLTT